MLSKPDMWESEEFRQKFAKIPKPLQAKFLCSIQDLYRQESDSMLKFIQMSRKSLQLTGSEIRDEQDVLKLTSQKLSAERDRSSVASRASHISTRSYPPQSRRSKPYAPSPEPMSTRPHPHPPGTVMHYENEEYDDAEDEEFFKEETDQIMRATSRADNVHANEKARQLEKIERMKKEKQARKEAHHDQAHELLREASNLEKHKLDQKKKQDDLVKARLEERRKQNKMTSLGVDGRSSALPDVDVDTDAVRTPRTRSPATIPTTPEPAKEEPPAATPSAEPKKDKKKDKKDKKKKDKKDKKKKDNGVAPGDSPV